MFHPRLGDHDGLLKVCIPPHLIGTSSYPGRVLVTLLLRSIAQWALMMAPFPGCSFHAYGGHNPQTSGSLGPLGTILLALRFADSEGCPSQCRLARADTDYMVGMPLYYNADL